MNYLVDNAAREAMMSIYTYFNAQKLNDFCLMLNGFLSREGGKIYNHPPDTLYTSPFDYLSLLKFFPQTRIKQDFEIRGCYFYQQKTKFLFGDVWAQHKDSIHPDNPPSVSGYRISRPDKALSVSEALEDLTKAEDYMANSIFMRALSYITNLSIHSEWLSTNIIDINNGIDSEYIHLPYLAKKLLSSTDHPKSFHPHVEMNKSMHRHVTFYVYSPVYPANISCHTDIYVNTNPKFETKRKSLVSIPQGIIID